MADIDTLRRGIASLPKTAKKLDVQVLGQIGFSFKDPRNELVIFERQLAAALNKSIRDAGPAYISRLSRLLDATMDANLPWDGFQGRVTQRKNGSVATFPRNIVDLGELKASKRLVRTPAGVEIYYDADYAASVHWGFRNARGGTFVPGRPWVVLALNEQAVDPKGEINQLIRKSVEDDLNFQFKSRR